MVVWIQPSGNTNRIVTTTILGIAQIATFVRLTLRIRAKRFRWDDGWAIVALTSSFILMVGMWIRTDLSRSRSTRVVAYWMVVLSFTCTLWAGRMSVIFSIIRIIPHTLKLRKVTVYCAVLFGSMWVALLVHKVYHCASDESWYALAKPQCHLGTGVAVLELCTDLTADLVLAAIPIALLRSVRTISSGQRRLLFIIFAASLLTTVVSIVHAVYLLGPSGLLEAITAQAEAAVSLLVANAAVVLPSIYRRFRKRSDHEVYDYALDADGIVRMKKVGPSQNNDTLVFQRPVSEWSALETRKPETSLCSEGSPQTIPSELVFGDVSAKSPV
ncbi:hypothetical protein B0H11DRAFT_1971098 [Mycena galericulata]|nr:hypothetical protein B0H11DRAFT_1971098 [Mycena galericulata]